MEKGTDPDELAQQYDLYPYLPGRGPPRRDVQQQMSVVCSLEGYRQSSGRQNVHRNNMQPQGSGRRGATRGRIHRSSETAAAHSLDQKQNVALQSLQYPFSSRPVTLTHRVCWLFGTPSTITTTTTRNSIGNSAAVGLGANNKHCYTWPKCCS